MNFLTKYIIPTKEETKSYLRYVKDAYSTPAQTMKDNPDSTLLVIAVITWLAFLA